MYNALVLSVLLYGCETWPLRAGEVNDLNVFHHKCLRCILGLRLSDRVSNDVIRRRCSDIPLVFDVVKARRLRWFGHTRNPLRTRRRSLEDKKRHGYQQLEPTSSQWEVSRSTGTDGIDNGSS
ncbi:uncharacterized protein LOC136043021 [Artemia franciscana]|uniref:uncharacterized protein LOC136027752 n=1 Tax=Artemia franciscana TaxID=6661 RepID=UPI0032DAE8FE